MSKLRRPRDLGPAGRKLWRELVRCYAFEVGETAGLSELCKIHDRLTQVRTILSAEGLVVEKKPHPLATLEVKLSGAFRMLWRTLRLDIAERTK